MISCSVGLVREYLLDMIICPCYSLLHFCFIYAPYDILLAAIGFEGAHSQRLESRGEIAEGKTELCLTTKIIWCRAPSTATGDQACLLA